MIKIRTSRPLSLDGYDFRVWLKENKKNVKLLVSALAGIATNASVGLGPVWSGVAGITVALASSFLLDFIDFYASEVEVADEYSRL